MTQRDRQASAGVSEAAPRPSAPPAPPRGPAWEELFRGLRPGQQTELLELALRQGVVYGHQLPAPRENGALGERRRHVLTRLLARQSADLEPFRPEPVAVQDAALDADQRRAVALALQTPDLALIQGLPGTGKSRVVAEIVAQAAARGERVLLLAPAAAALDRILELVASREAVCPVRCLGRDEKPEALPPCARAVTFAERARYFREHTLVRAHEEVEAAERRHEALQGVAPAWDGLARLAEEAARARAEADALRNRRAETPARVEREASGAEPAVGDGFRDAVRAARAAEEERARHAAAESEAVRNEVDQRRREVEQLTAELASLLPLADAKHGNRVWSVAWWRATLSGNVVARAEELRGKQAGARAALDALEGRARRLEADQRQAAEQAAAAMEGLVALESARRLGELQEQEKALARERDGLSARWEASAAVLEVGARPAEVTPTAVAEAREAWRRDAEDAGQRAAFARQWADFAETEADNMPRRLAECANLVAVTTAALAADPYFGDGARSAPFDLLVLEEAEQVTESEFLAAARRAARWALVGEPASGPEGPPARGKALPQALRPGFFQKLWQHLHCDPSRLPYSWAREQDRLCCRMRRLTAEQQRWLESERVADFPDVELRIVAPPRGEPVLAEVVFPATMTPERARQYIFQELDELAVQATARAARWREEPGRLVLDLGGPAGGDATAVELEPGVREWVAPGRTGDDLGHTRAVEFEAEAGWPRPRAEEWAQRHLGLRDLGRTVLLDVPHRMHADLAALVSDLVCQGGYRRPCGALPADPLADWQNAAVEFEPVPGAAQRSMRRRGEPEPRARGGGTATAAPRSRVVREGAGLEIDLADASHPDQLPAELRAALPVRGTVNYLEAQVLVRTLARLVSDPAFRDVASSWRPAAECPTECGMPERSACRIPHSAFGVPVAVVALYPAQAELIRRLAEQNPAIASSGVALRIDVPEAFRQRECLVALVSLTRSHSHRAVSFGDGPQALALALTRARGRVVLFGDPGTLARRSQWQRPVDHLDEAASAREQELVGELVRYLHGHGPHPRSFHLREGSGA